MQKDGIINTAELDNELLSAEEAETVEAGQELQDIAEPDKSDEIALLLEDARSKADAHWDQLVRTKAELDNLKKRHARDLENAHKYGLDRFVEALVGVWDSLELGYLASKDEDADLQKVIEGTGLTLKQLQDVMNKFGVEQLDPDGEVFNPELHQAMSLAPSNNVPANTVIHVMQKGYTLNGRLVRPALVVVSQAES